MKMERSYGAAKGQWKRVVLGIGVGFLTMLVMTAASAWLIENEVIGRAHMGLLSVTALVLGGFLGAMCSGRGEGRFIRSASVAAGLIMVLLLVNLALFGGSWAGVLPGAAAVLGSAAAAALIRGEKRGRGHGKIRYRKYANR